MHVTLFLRCFCPAAGAWVLWALALRLGPWEWSFGWQDPRVTVPAPAVAVREARPANGQEENHPDNLTTGQRFSIYA